MKKSDFDLIEQLIDAKIEYLSRVAGHFGDGPRVRSARTDLNSTLEFLKDQLEPDE